jgi:hypothetical protein
MLLVTTLMALRQRLDELRVYPWGPDGTRYMCVLFWDDLGYRILDNTVDAETWSRWSRSSGEFWDLFLAGCYDGASPDLYGTRAQILADGPRPFLWNSEKSAALARHFSDAAMRAGAIPQWEFSGPIELVVVAVRKGEEPDWASLRAVRIDAVRLGEAVAAYTEAHVSLDPDVLPDFLVAPGDFADDLPREVLRELLRQIGFIGRLFRTTIGR